ncbi:MAG: thiamine pyrophosphate-dependent enzyme [Candidatus Micrarchaeota archaeon]
MAEDLFLKGHTACSGCGCSLCMRWILNTLGRDAVIVNGTGCMEIVSTQFPTSTWAVPYVHSVFANPAAVASGVSRAFKKLGRKGIVTVIAGDGSTYDIGFAALSGAMERNEDMIYICYDNETYANTGVQRSGATPFASETTTSPFESGGKHEWKKDIAFIAAAHGIPYVATASVSFLPDLEKKLLKAKQMNGFRLIVVHAPCTLGWRIPTEKMVEVSRMAVNCGLWNLFEIEGGKFSMSAKPNLEPVDNYLRAQGRFKHISPEQIRFIQEHVRATRSELEKLEASGVNVGRIL